MPELSMSEWFLVGVLSVAFASFLMWVFEKMDFCWAGD